MTKFKKRLILGFTIMACSALSLSAFAVNRDFGAAGVDKDQNYTLEQMLTYAVQDEYLALAEYEKIMETFGTQRPFTNIARAETTHIALLEQLFNKYDIAVPENVARDYVVIPDTFYNALKTGVQAEIDNIGMYEIFLSQNLPDDVKSAFTALKNASQNHLSAFERSSSQMGSDTAGANRAGMQRGRNRSQGW